MAYCGSCGAYIPDGQSKCLACGFDEAAKAREEKKASSANTARQRVPSKDYQQAQDELRRKLEEQRRAQQEQNRQWAEQERARRAQQEESRRWAEEEYQRRQQEKTAESYVNRASSVVSSAIGSPNKALAALSYVSFLFALPYIFTPDDEFARFHAGQGLRLFIFGVIMDLIPVLNVVSWVARIYLAYKGISNAVKDKMEPLPYIGTIGNK